MFCAVDPYWKSQTNKQIDAWCNSVYCKMLHEQGFYIRGSDALLVLINEVPIMCQISLW